MRAAPIPIRDMFPSPARDQAARPVGWDNFPAISSSGVLIAHEAPARSGAALPGVLPQAAEALPTHAASNARVPSAGPVPAPDPPNPDRRVDLPARRRCDGGFA